MRLLIEDSIAINVDWKQEELCVKEVSHPKLLLSVVTSDHIVIQGEKMAVTLTDIQHVALSITALDAKGNPAAVDGAPEWSVSDPALLTITPAADGMSADLVAVGPLGTGQVTVSADALIGEGTTPLTGILDVTVVSSQAATIGITAGTPENV